MTDGNNTGSDNIWPESSETMNGAQRIYLQRLCGKAGVAFDDSWSEAQALERIKELEA
ncbi:hypothetical protein GCM10028792_07970 [Salinisphaera aquimarina]